MSVALGVHRRLEDGVGQRDDRLQVRRTGAPQGLVPREFGSGKIHLLEAIHGDDCGEERGELVRVQTDRKQLFFSLCSMLRTERNSLFYFHLKKKKPCSIDWLLACHILCSELTNVRCDDGERAEVCLPHVLCQCVGVLLVVAQQRRCAALRVLDQLPVQPCVGRQDGAAHTDQILSPKKKNQRAFGVTGCHSGE